MKFQVETRASIPYVELTIPHVIISISDTVDVRADPKVNDFTLDVLFLAFHDINQIETGFDLFKDSQAAEILKFYEAHKDRAELIVAHCNAGMSRSPAVLAALQKIHTGDDSIWFKTKSPNSYVYSTILGVAHERGLYDPFAKR